MMNKSNGLIIKKVGKIKKKNFLYLEGRERGVNDRAEDGLQEEETTVWNGERLRKRVNCAPPHDLPRCYVCQQELQVEGDVIREIHNLSVI